MADSLPILAAEEREWEEGQGDQPDAKFSELPPPYSEHENLQEQASSRSSPELRVYGVRWYILVVFGLLACHQCVVWNTWGPIESGAQFAFTWPDSTVPMFANWGTIMFLLSVLPLSKLVEVDLRKTVLLVSGFVALGTVLRCGRKFINNPTIFLISCHACAILNGISGVTVMAAPPLISSTWFPSSERTTATAIGQAFNALGNGVAMLLGPALIHYQPGNGTNTTQHFTAFQPSTSNSSQTKEQVQDDIDTYMEVLAAVAVTIFGLFIVYFPSKPPHPPSPSSAVERTEFISGIKALLTNKDALLACFAYSIALGVMGAWMSVMVNQVRPLGYTDQQIGMMGLASVLSQCIMGMLFGYMADHLRHKMKLTLLVLLVVATGGFTWLMLMCLPGSGFPHTIVRLYLAIIVATGATCSCAPLFFEMTVELAYPVSESTVAGFLTAMGNMVGMFFLLLFFIPALSSGTCMWMSYSLVASTAIAIPATALVREQYNRSNVDEVALNT